MKTAQFINDDVSTACRATGVLHAVMVQDMLEKVGIPVMLHYESIGLASGARMNLSSDVDLFVPECLVEEARALLSAQLPNAISAG